MLLTSGIANAQSPFSSIFSETDSLTRLKKLDSVHLHIKQYTATSVDTVIFLFDELLTEINKDRYPVEYGRALSLKAWYITFKTRYEESLKLAHQALEIQLKTNDSLGIAKSYNIIGIINLYYKRYDASLTYLEKSRALFTQLKDTVNLDMLINNLGVLYSESDRDELAIKYYKESYGIRREQNLPFWAAYSLFNIAESFKNLDQLDSTEFYIKKSIRTFETETTSGKVPAMVYVGYAELLYAQKNFSQALKYAELGLEISRSKQNSEMEVVAMGVLVNIYESQEDFKNAFAHQRELNELTQRVDSLNSAENISEIEEKYQNAQKRKEISELKRQSLIDKNNLQKLELAVLTSVIFFIVAFGIIGFIFIKRRQKQALLLEKNSRDQQTLKLSALQAQMSPHFIFNCINTAQSFMLDDKKKEGYMYLSMFSKLLRMVLTNSNKPHLPFEDELEQLKLYIELESIRFNEHFTYHINVDPALEEGILEVPGMILQSFVENAILHGLMNLKDKTGKLEIDFKKEGNLLFCSITDNGIGRKAAQELKKQKEIHYSSVALPNVEERLRLMNSITKDDLQLDIIDLYNNDIPAGTRVKIMLPLL